MNDRKNENENKEYTFLKLIEECKIEMPIMQRDYAQGRESEKIEKIRKRFLDDIYNALINNKKLNLDFVYGSVEKTVEGKKLILIDGQQRITTLFLLHWYLANKDNKMSEEMKSKFRRFTYETRISSREFVEKIIENGINFEQLENRESLSKYIIDQPWFFIYWQRDPTIKAMLTMLDSIHEKFKNGASFEKLDNKALITFYFLPLESFKLTDELYIKMNARGKLLTEFENFKAEFGEFLKDRYKNDLTEFKIKDEQVSYGEYFSQKIDGDWTDLFWEFRDKDNSIDTALMNYFCFITEMLYYQEYEEPLEYVTGSSRPEIEISFKNKSKDETSLEDNRNKRVRLNFANIYSNKANVEFLFKSLDKWLEIARNNPEKIERESVKEFFEDIFSKNSYQKGKVALFSDNINLFERAVNNENFDIFEKILLFAILKYLIVFCKGKPDESLKHFVRVIRNLLLSIRQLSRPQIRYNSNLRYENIFKYMQGINDFLVSDNIYNNLEIGEISGFTKNALENEKYKAKIIVSNPQLKETIFKLEDHPLLKSMIFNLISDKEILNKLQNVAEELYKIWEPGQIESLNNYNSLIIRAMLTFGDYAIWIGKTNLGGKFFFGKDERWEVVLTYESENENEKEKVRNILNKFLLKLVELKSDAKSKLGEIVEKWLKDKDNEDKKNWFYYFIKYMEMTENIKKFGNTDRNTYAWENDFEVEKINGGYTLNALHISPYVYTVIRRLANGESSINIDDSFSIYSEESKISLKNGTKMYCKKEGWEIEFPDGFDENTKNKLIEKFELKEKKPKEDKNIYLLKTLKNNKDSEDKIDRIEIAKKFINYAFQQTK